MEVGVSVGGREVAVGVSVGTIGVFVGVLVVVGARARAPGEAVSTIAVDVRSSVGAGVAVFEAVGTGANVNVMVGKLETPACRSAPRSAKSWAASKPSPEANSR